MNDETGQRMRAAEFAALAGRIRSQLARRIVGLDAEIDLVLCAVLCGRHVLVEGVPGLGKTLFMKSLADVLGCTFKRIQFTPDLLPADILGGFVYDPRDGSFNLRRGPIFANAILADEINRAPAKTQSALLEVMQEKQVTLEGETLPVDEPFLVFATQNPIEHEGVYPLPQAQLDRFAIRLLVEYPTPKNEFEILAAYRESLPELHTVADPETLLACRSVADNVTVSDEILTVIVELGNRIREHDDVLLGTSPRAGVDLLQLARCRALLAGREHVLPDDIKSLLAPVANHRIVLAPQAEVGGLTPQEVIHEALESTELV